MFGLPLHPLVVHFPVVLVVLLPISALVALWAIRRGTDVRRSWAVPLTLAAALAVSAFVALKTGEAQEEKVEDVIAEGALNPHEEAAERFLVLSGVLVLVAGAGLVRGQVGRAARIVATAGAVGLVAAGVQVGHSGATLVYRDNAASAYANAAGTPAARDGGAGGARAERGGDDDGR